MSDDSNPEEEMREEYDFAPEELREAVRGKYAARLDDALSVLESMAGAIEGPPDWAEEHDHYIHGTSKRSDRQDETSDNSSDRG